VKSENFKGYPVLNQYVGVIFFIGRGRGECGVVVWDLLGVWHGDPGYSLREFRDDGVEGNAGMTGLKVMPG
jgi:hypothetical protein